MTVMWSSWKRRCGVQMSPAMALFAKTRVSYRAAFGDVEDAG